MLCAYLFLEMLKIKSEKLTEVLRQLHNTIKVVVYVKGEWQANISEINKELV